MSPIVDNTRQLQLRWALRSRLLTDEEMARLSLEKEKRYQEEFLPHLALLPGLMTLLEKAYQQGIPMAIGSAAIPFNIEFVLDNLNIRHYFNAIVSADDVMFSKPHPETFLKATTATTVPITGIALRRTRR